MNSQTTELRNFFLWINTNSGAEKITIGSGVPGEHYTIRFWSRRKCLDLHMTNEFTGEHKKIFEIKYYTLLKLSTRMLKTQEYLIRKYLLANTINLGKLKRNNCILFAQSSDKSDFSDILKIGNRRLKFRKNAVWTKLANFFVTPEDLLQSNKEIFQVYKNKNGYLQSQGYLYKFQNRNREKVFNFITKNNFRLFNKHLIITAYNLLDKQIFENKEKTMKVFFENLNCIENI